MNCFIYDIETIPDTEFGREYYQLGDLSDAEVATAMQFNAQQKTGSDFLPLAMHRVVAISGVLRRGDQLKVWTLGELDSSEGEMIQRFYDGIEKFEPTLVSWNGSGFDLPVLHYRALRHGCVASRYWEMGDEDNSYRYNNYLSRFHWRHVDLMDVVAGFQPRARASLDQVATLLGFPGKLGMSGADVWPTYLDGKLQAIRDYCETDVINTYLVYLRFEAMRGRLDKAELAREIEKMRDLLEASDAAHLKDYLAAWQAS